MFNILYSAIKKCQINPYSKEHEYYGCLTPVEIITLVNYGVIPTQSNKYILIDAREKKIKGICNPRWFYFFPNIKFRKWHERL